MNKKKATEIKRAAIRKVLGVLAELVADHYWDSLESDKEIIKKHWNAISAGASKKLRKLDKI